MREFLLPPVVAVASVFALLLALLAIPVLAAIGVLFAMAERGGGARMGGLYGEHNDD